MPSSPDAHWSLEIYPGVPSMDDMIALYKKVISEMDEVLSEIDIAIAIQKNCHSCHEQAAPRHSQDSIALPGN